MNPIKIPKQIKVGGHYYAISYEEGLEARFNKLGTSDINGGKITIEPNSMDSFKSATLIHEVLHIIGYHNCNRKLDEEIIQSLSESLWLLLEQHGVAFDWSGIE